jgi:hypothetical protein
MGMSSDEFWDMLPEEFDARRYWFEEYETQKEMRFGVIASAYANTKLKEGYPPIQPLAWFGYEAPDEEMSDERMLQQMMAFAEQHNKQLGLPS